MAERPTMPQRVVWITTDHMRFDCVGAYGNGAIHTPNLDALAAGGVNFLNCFGQNPVCMPSRASFMTGLYPQQTGVTRNGHCLPPDFRPTVASVFGAAGYETAQIGKLHFQPHENHDLDPRPRHTYGFDVFSASEEKGCYEDAYMAWLRGRYPQHVEAFRIPRPTSPERMAWEKPGGRVVEAPWQASQAGWVVHTAERYFAARPGGRRFVHLGFYNPHPPLNPTREAFAPYEGAEIPRPRFGEQEWADKPEPLASMLHQRDGWSDADLVEYRRYFHAMVTEVDLAVGRLIDSLRADGTLDDTLIVFSSDHGDLCGDHRMTHKGPSFFDELMHLPLILHWPAALGRERRDVPGLVEMVDLLPTLLGLCGAPVPDVMIGRSYAADLLAGRTPDGRDDVFAYHDAGQAMLRTDRWKYLRYEPHGTEVLYDLSEQPLETTNRAADPACAEVLAEMRQRMLARSLVASRSPLPRLHPF
jgi:arylsulfatase A-like enzyme